MTIVIIRQTGFRHFQGFDLHADLSSEGWRNKSPGNTHSRWQTSTTKKRKHSQRFCKKSACTVNIDSHELTQYSFVNTSSNANAVSFDAKVSSADEMYENEDNYKRMESVARYTSYYRFLLGTRQAASVKPSMSRSECRRVSAVVALNAADNRQVSPLTKDEVHSFLRATVLRPTTRLAQTATC